MSTEQILTALQRRWRIAVLVTFLGLAGGILGVVLTSKKYESRTQLFVTSGQSAANITDVYQGGLFTQQRVESYVSLITNTTVTEPVIHQLGLPMTPAALASEISAANPTNTVLIDVTVRDRSARRAQEIAAAVASRFVEVATQLETPSPGSPPPVEVRISQPASFSSNPVVPRVKLDVILGLVLGLVVGLAAALLRDFLDRSVKSSVELEHVLQHPAIGVIPTDGNLNRARVLSEPGTPRAEAVRVLRTNLRFLRVDDPPKSVAFTSALPSEGKSSTVCALAAVVGELGVKVALLEADLRAPSIAKYLEIPSEIGLTNVLVGSAQLHDAAVAWREHVTVIPAGLSAPNPSELLSSTRMAHVLEQLEADFDLVLIDSPPVLVASDALVIGARADSVVVVTRSHKTRRDLVQRAVEMLAAVDAHVVGGVLNMVRQDRSGAAYGYGYGYGYGETASAPETAGERTTA